MITSRNIFFIDYYLIFLLISEIIVALEINPILTSIRGIICIGYIVLLVLLNWKQELFRSTASHLLLVFMIFSAMLIVFARDPLSSAYQFSRVVVSLMLFPLGHVIISDSQKLNLVNKVILRTMPLLSIYLIVAVILGIGGSRYLDDEYRIGGVNLNTLTYIIILAPPILFHLKPKLIRIHFLSIITMILFVLISLKRTTSIILLTSFLIYFILLSRKYKYQYLKYAIVVILIGVITSPIYLELLKLRFESRREKGVFNADFLEKEGRKIEFDAVVRETFSFEDMEYSLIGRNIFDTPMSYGLNVRHKFGKKRVIHDDFALLINSTGLIGTLLYFGFLHKLVKYAKLIYHKKRSSIDFSQIIYIILLFVSTLQMFNGSFFGITNRSIVMIYLGAIYGFHVNRTKTKFTCSPKTGPDIKN